MNRFIYDAKKYLYLLEFLLIICIYADIRDLFLVKTDAIRKIYYNSFDVAEYVVDGNSYILEIPHGNLLKSGDLLTIGHYKNAPEKSIIYHGVDYWTLFIFISIIITQKIISSRQNMPARLKKKGKKIEVEYESAYVEVRYFKIFYIMKFKYIDPETNEMIELTNDDFKGFNPDKLIKEKGITKFTAYIDPQIPSMEHYVVIDPLYENSVFLKEKIFIRK